VEREKLDDAIINFNLQLVDGVFFFEDALGERFIGFEDGVDGLMDGALGEAAHPQEPLFQLVQIFFEVAFHELIPLKLSNSVAISYGISARADHPKRPVM
jgi:hypothetical protein